MFSFFLSVARSWGQTNPFSVQPKNTYGIVGQNVTLQCEVTDGTQTFWIQADGKTVADSISGVYDTFKDKYTLTNQGTTYTLTLMNGVLDDAARYGCNSQYHSSTAYAEIIMLGNFIVIFFLKDG